MSGNIAVELVGIEKSFGAVRANDGVSVAVARGTVHGLIGENGAGKSTLMSILYGTYTADAGEIRLFGRPVGIRSSADALRHGIGMVHQHFMLVDTFTVLENVMLGAEGGRWLRRGAAAIRKELKRLADEFGLAVDPEAVAGDLPVGIRQRVEILKALYRGAEILILDEPTAVLTPQEADHLFRILRALAADGKTVILITHKLREVMAVCTDITVMRGGRVVGSRSAAATSPAELAALMIGRSVAPPPRPGNRRSGAAALEVRDLSVRDGAGIERVRGLSLVVHEGEIVGIAGVAGNGQSELLAALAGVRAPASGRISIAGVDVTGEGARGRRRRGLAHVPEDRLRQGVIAEFIAAESAILGDQGDAAYAAGPFLRRSAVIGITTERMTSYDVRPHDWRLRTSLFSGGNQQKLVCGREMERRPRILLVGQPTRGVDIGAIEFIHGRLIALRDAGCAILLVSVELDEIRALADRILVLSGGVLVGELRPEAASEERLGLMMAGVAPAG